MTIRIATGIVRRGDRVLLVASRYANHEKPLWTLPGGRQEDGELASETVVREIAEETELEARVIGLAYVSESYDGSTHVSNVTFSLDASGEPRVPAGSDHVVEAAWVPPEEIVSRMTVAVAREPLLAYLCGDARRYFGFHDAGITIRWSD